MPRRTVNNADFAATVTIPAAGHITILLPTTCNKIMLSLDDSNVAQWQIMLNPDDINNQGATPAFQKGYFWMDENQLVTIDGYWIHSFDMIGDVGSQFSYIAFVPYDEPRLAYGFDTP